MPSPHVRPGPLISLDAAAGGGGRRARWRPALLVMLLLAAGAWSGRDALPSRAETPKLQSPGGGAPGGEVPGGEGQGPAAAARRAATPPAGELSQEAQAEPLLRLRQRRAGRRERLERVLAERSTLEQELAPLQGRILEKERELAVFAGDLAEHQRALRGLEEHAARLRRGATLLREGLGQGLRRLYKEYKLDAPQPWHETGHSARLLRQARYAAEVAGADLQLLHTYQAARAALRAAQERFAERTAAIETLRQTAAERLRELVELRRRKEQLLVALLDERSEIVASLQDLDAARAQVGEPSGAPSPPSGAAPQPPQAHPDGEATPGAAEDFASLKGTLPWPATGRLLPRPPIASLPALPAERQAPEASSPPRGGQPQAPNAAPGASPGTARRAGLNGDADSAAPAQQETDAPAGTLDALNRAARLQSIQISVEPGAPIRSIAPGVVQFAETLPGYGKLLIIHHGKGYHSLYANLGTILVRVGDQVETLQAVGEAVRQPAKAPPALYFELRFHGIPENPLHWLADKPAS